MQQVYCANQTYNLNTPLISSQIKIFLNNQGRLCQIIWYHRTAGKISEHPWRNVEREQWDFKDANENDLIRVFKQLALGNPKDFKELYFNLKEHDNIVFPCIETALIEIKKMFDFE